MFDDWHNAHNADRRSDRSSDDPSPREDTERLPLEDIRRRLVDRVILVAAVVFIPVAIAVVLRPLPFNRSMLPIIYVLALIVIWVLALLRRHTVWQMRALVFLAILLVLGGVSYFSYGLASIGLVFLVSFVILTLLIFGLHFSMLALALATIVIVSAGLAITLHWVSVRIDFNQYNLAFTPWGAQIVAFVFFVGMLLSITHSLYASLLNVIATSEHREKDLEDLTTRLQSEVTVRVQAEEALKKERDRAKQYMEIAGVIIVVLDQEQRVTMVNKKGADLLGVSTVEIIGKNWIDNFVHEEDREKSRSAFRELMAGRMEFAEFFESRVLSRAGEERLIAWHHTLLRDEQGNITGTLSSGEDITVRRQAEDRLLDREGFLRRVIDTAPSMIFVKDWNGRFVLVNAALARAYGTTPEESIGKSDADFNPDMEEVEHFLKDDREVIRTLKMKIIPEEPVTQADGQVRWYTTVKVPLINPDGTCDKLLGVASDITVRRQAAEQVRKLNRTLAMLSAVNELLIRTTDESSLLQGACCIITDKGGYRMAWIGFAEHDEAKTIKPVARCGCDDGYLDTIRMTWSDTELGRGPAGVSIRTGKPGAVSNISTDPLYAPWRDEALKRGYASAISVPLIWNGQAIGTVSLYLGEPDSFDPEEVNLLTELASDISYGIMSIRAREELKIVDEHKRDFYRRTILAATEGKLVVTEPEEIERFSGPTIAVWEIRKPEDLSHIRSESAQIARAAGIEGSRLYDFIVCIGEVTTNAFKHASAGTASMHRHGDSLIMDVSDRGAGIEALVLPELALKRGYTTAVSLGMGFKAMISLADKVYLATGPNGTTVGIEMQIHPPTKTHSLLDNLPDTWGIRPQHHSDDIEPSQQSFKSEL